MTLGAVRALEDVSFELPPGESLAIIGPNGAGKSTLVKVLLGLLKPAAGRVKIFGAPVSASRQLTAYVPQLKTFDRTFPATALELVVTGIRRRWPARVSSAEAQAASVALERVGAGALAHRQLARLSGGELQRAYLARALVRRPALLFLDEPATGVDFLAGHDLHDLLEEYQRESGATVVMVTHDLSAARHHASRVLVLNRRLHGFGPPERALTRDCLEGAFGHLHHPHELPG